MDIFLSIQKLDPESHKVWESYVSNEYYDELPTFENFTTFLENRICTMELTSPQTARDKIKERSYNTVMATTSTSPTTSRILSCKLCQEEHLLCHCKEFGRMTPEKRSEFAKENRLCFNCLAMGHSVFYCRQQSTCKLCGKKHHSLLHSSKPKDDSTNTEAPKKIVSSLHNIVDNQETEEVLVQSHFLKHKRALLATALVPVKGSLGHVTVLRALVDTGSQISLLSERAAQTLRCKKTQVNGTVTGVGSTQTKISHVVQLEVLSSYEKDFILPVKAYVLSTPLTTKLPCKDITPINWSHLKGLNLADPNYCTPGKVDLLLGIDVYTEIVKNNLIKGPPGSPNAQDTHLGWILFGNINAQQKQSQQEVEEHITMHTHLELDIHNMLKNMWDIEDSSTRKLTQEERTCENMYISSHSRAPDGRYIVKLPFKSENPIEEVGDTKDIATHRFYQLERKLERNAHLQEEYCKVIDEYIELDHIQEVPEEEKSNPAIYLPHHAVLREDKETTKVRVVFDGSCKGTHNKSLNDELLVGPQLQDDLRSLIMRFRMHPICFVADIQKMYRQILVTREDANYQRILWRKNSAEDLKEYRLLRVTFGTSSAPYLAVRTLLQLADDEGEKMGFHKSAQIVKEDFFVDDCMSGSSNLEEAIEVSKELTNVLHKGGIKAKMGFQQHRVYRTNRSLDEKRECQ